jgi:hypothetical protein
MSSRNDEPPVLAEVRPQVRGARTIIKRRDGRLLRRQTVYLPDPLSRALAVRCAALDCSCSDFIAALVQRALGGEAAPVDEKQTTDSKE